MWSIAWYKSKRKVIINTIKRIRKKQTYAGAKIDIDKKAEQKSTWA